MLTTSKLQKQADKRVTERKLDRKRDHARTESIRIGRREGEGRSALIGRGEGWSALIGRWGGVHSPFINREMTMDSLHVPLAGFSE